MFGSPWFTHVIFCIFFQSAPWCLPLSAVGVPYIILGVLVQPALKVLLVAYVPPIQDTNLLRALDKDTLKAVPEACVARALLALLLTISSH